MIKHERWHLIVAFGVGALLVIAPIILLIVLNALDKMETRWYMYLIFIPVGIFSIVRGFMFVCDNRNIHMLKTQGVKVKGRYISHGTRQGDRSPMYYVRYSYKDERGETVMATSPAEYSWEQALAFRAADEFDVLYKNGISMIAQDAASLYEGNFEKVTALKKAYNEAFNVVYRDMIEEAERKQKKQLEKQSDDYNEEGGQEDSFDSSEEGEQEDISNSSEEEQTASGEEEGKGKTE